MGEPDLAASAAPLRAFALRLAPGEDLRAALEARARESGCAALCVVTCVGSLAPARVRLAFEHEEIELAGPLEIVSLVGTLSPDGPHLHVAVADRAGKVHGGHLLPGSRVHTTAEVVLAVLEDVRFARALDPRTGWRELVVHPRDRE